MKYLLLLLLFPLNAYALNCRFETNPPGTSKFLWKPKAEHFNKVVILPHQTYYDRGATVSLFNAKNEKRIERAVIKHEDLCDGSDHCSAAKAFLTTHNGRYYAVTYHSLIVRVSEHGKESRCFRIPHPNKRIEYRG